MTAGHRRAQFFKLPPGNTFDEHDAMFDVIPEALRPELAKAKAFAEELRRVLRSRTATVGHRLSK